MNPLDWGLTLAYWLHMLATVVCEGVRPRKVDASVEDPLGDWPED